MVSMHLGQQKEASPNQLTPWNSCGAQGGTRTRTRIHLLERKPSGRPPGQTLSMYCQWLVNTESTGKRV